MESAGSIPVARTPRDSTGTKPQRDLFAATYAFLASGGALGVFPEGTSYTLPRIVQVKEGAARAALEFVKHAKENGVEDEDVVQIVPVGIVPTDKAQYRSRVYVEYGEPLSLAPYIRRFVLDDEGARSAVHDLTQQIERELVKLTINAPDWSTLYASRMARDLLWGQERNVPLDKFVDISQSLIELFSDDGSVVSLRVVKRSLLRYHSLLHHIGLAHASLPESYLKALLNVIPTSVPLVLALPVHITHLPGYILGALAMQKLGGDEEEAQAQYGAIIGGVGVGVGTASGSWFGLKIAKKLGESGTAGRWIRNLGVQEMVGKIVNSFVLDIGKKVAASIARSWVSLGRMGDALCVLGFAWLLCKCHNKIIDANYARFQRIRAIFTVLSSLLSPRLELFGWTNPLLLPYLTTPPPPANPFVSASASFNSAPEGILKPKIRLSRRKLVGPLFQARREASEALGAYLRDLEATDGGDSVRTVKAGGEDEGYESVDEDSVEERREKNENKREILARLRRFGAEVDKLP